MASHGASPRCRAGALVWRLVFLYAPFLLRRETERRRQPDTHGDPRRRKRREEKRREEKDREGQRRAGVGEESLKKTKRSRPLTVTEQESGEDRQTEEGQQTLHRN